MKQCDFMVSVTQLVPLQIDGVLRYLRPLIDNPAQCHVELLVDGASNLIELPYILNKDGPTFHNGLYECIQQLVLFLLYDTVCPRDTTKVEIYWLKV